MIILETTIKYFFIFILAFYFFTKSDDFHIVLTKKLVIALISLGLAVVFYYLKYFSVPLHLIIVVFMLILSTKLVFGVSINNSAATGIISYGISYATYLCSLILASPIAYFLLKYFITTETYAKFEIISCLASGAIQTVLAKVAMNNKRLKSGIKHLCTHSNSSVGVFISVLILLVASMITMENEYKSIFIMPILFLFTCGAALFFWWKNRTTEMYRGLLKARELESFKLAVKELNREIEQLRLNNDELAKVIHKDNKLIPAMCIAVEKHANVNISSNKIQKDEISSQLNELLSQREELLKVYHKNQGKTDLTGFIRLDAMMSLMKQKSLEDNITLDCSYSANVKHLIETQISEEDLVTLLADLIENALIATRGEELKRILLNIGVNNGFYYIEVFDSGTPFLISTLHKLGSHKVTTHKVNGGSGIGYITIFEIMHKTGASLLIKEIMPHNFYSKSVSIVFDGNNQYHINSYRKSEIKQNCGRDDISIN